MRAGISGAGVSELRRVAFLTGKTVCLESFRNTQTEKKGGRGAPILLATSVGPDDQQGDKRALI